MDTASALDHGSNLSSSAVEVSKRDGLLSLRTESSHHFKLSTFTIGVGRRVLILIVVSLRAVALVGGRGGKQRLISSLPVFLVCIYTTKLHTD